MLQKLNGYNKVADERDSFEDLIGKELKVLDHGFVRVVDYMGSDSAVVQAARVSYGTGTKKYSEDRGLIRYLMRHRHSSPFEMCEIKLHVKLPIFVARQWIRHRTANVNEYSARYSVLDKEFYVPDRGFVANYTREMHEKELLSTSADLGQEDLFGAAQSELASIAAVGRQSQTNKQGREELGDEAEAVDHLKTITNISARTYNAYQKLLNETSDGKKQNPGYSGIARELARIVLPTNYYTQWYWKIDLHNLLHFLNLRADGHAQYEIREYANIIGDIVKKWVPLTWEAFIDYRRESVSLSRQEVELLKQMLHGEKPKVSASGLTKREWIEFSQKFGLSDSG